MTTPYQPFRAPMRALDFHPVADLFPMMSERELADLAADIREHGLREPVWLHRDGRIVDGRNRYRACLSVGVEPETRTYDGDDENLVSFVVSLNLHRRHLSESQRSMVAARIANMRQGERTDLVEPFANLQKVTQAEAAEQLQVSPRSVADARKVQTEGVPELAARVDAGEVAVSTAAEVATVEPERQRAILRQVDPREIIRAATEIKAQRREQRVADKVAAVAEIATRPVESLNTLGPFPVIYADPPWRYDHMSTPELRSIENHYPTMTTEDICALDVPAADDAVLFLWATSPKLVEAMRVLDAWGFTYTTCMVWVKDKIGMGYYARQQHELLLIGKRGALPVPDPEDRPSSVIQATRGVHSAKPDVVYELMERMYPLRERCELFQRRPRDGWAGWGNQVAA